MAVSETVAGTPSAATRTAAARPAADSRGSRRGVLALPDPRAVLFIAGHRRAR